jgi:hypothetical protein
VREYIDGVMFPSDLQGTVLESVWATETQLNNDEYMEGKPGSGSVPYMDDFFEWCEENHLIKIPTNDKGWYYYTFKLMDGVLITHKELSPL